MVRDVRGRFLRGGRGGVNPSPGTGDLGLRIFDEASTRPEAKGLGGLIALHIPPDHVT